MIKTGISRNVEVDIAKVWGDVTSDCTLCLVLLLELVNFQGKKKEIGRE